MLGYQVMKLNLSKEIKYLCIILNDKLMGGALVKTKVKKRL